MELKNDVAGLQTALDEKTNHWEEAIGRISELETDVNGLMSALNEKTSHWVEAYKRSKELELETEKLSVPKTNQDLYNEIHLLKFRIKQLSDLHDTVVINSWDKNNGQKDIMCMNPFKNIEILAYGDVSMCCSGWLKHGFTIGNVYKDVSFDEIWNSENAKKLRYSVTEGDFEYCSEYCMHLKSHKWNEVTGFDRSPIVTRDKEKYKFDNYRDCYTETTPEIITLSCDVSCNLHCISCRTKVQKNNKEENDKLQKMLDTVIRPALKNCKVLDMLPSGEFFFSKPLQDFVKSFTKEEFPELKINITTNAQLITIEKWNEFSMLKGMIDRITVSVDAAEKKTYELIRTGGNWERLHDALAILSDLRQKNEINLYLLSFVIQKENYREIPDFNKMAKMVKADGVTYNRIANWGTFSEKDFSFIDVMNPRNQNYGEAKHLISEAMKEQDIIVQQNIL